MAYHYNVQPMSHQLQTIDFIKQNPRCFDISDIGTGKTLSSLWAVDQLLMEKEVSKVLIISTLSTLGAVWAKELKNHFPHRTYTIIHGSRKKELCKAPTHFHIINHDGVVSLHNELLANKYDCMILDEMTACKSSDAIRTKRTEELAKRIKRVIGISGCPTPNSPIEAFSQVKIVNPNNYLLKRVKTLSTWKLLTLYQVGPTTYMEKPDTPQKVALMLQPSIRHTREKCIDIPEHQFIQQDIEMTSAQKIMYEDIRVKLLHELEEDKNNQIKTVTAANAAVKLNKLLQVSCGSVKDDEGNTHFVDTSNKIEFVKTIIEGTDSPIIIFCPYIGALELLKKSLPYKYEEIRGDVPQEARTKIIAEFQEGKTRVLLIQPRSTSHGVTLTRSHTIIWFGLLASGEIYNQANGRIIRYGQTQKQLIYHLICSGAERKLYDLLQKKSFSAKAVLSILEAEVKQQEVSVDTTDYFKDYTPDYFPDTYEELAF